MKEKQRDELIYWENLLLSDPLKFESLKGIEFLIKKGISFENLRHLIKRIYDINEKQLIEFSSANTGFVGFLNRKSTKYRKCKFKRRIDHQKEGEEYIKIYAEGDSWFQFPVFLRDIIDYLNTKDNFIIYPDAYGGDWITNILYEQQYVSALSTYSPEIFLISGGGNDLVGSHRLACMVANPSDYKKKYSTSEEIKSNYLNEEQKNMIILAQEYLNKEFYAMINLFKLQYTLMFDRLYRKESTKKNIISIIQGYDYALPTPKRRFSLRYPLQPLLNIILDSGDWLYTPLMAKGILDKKKQKAIIFTLIYEYNEILKSIAEKYENVYHVDNRGVATKFCHWFDELHLKNKFYKKIANAYELIIRNYGNPILPKSFRTVDYEDIKKKLLESKNNKNLQ